MNFLDGPRQTFFAIVALLAAAAAEASFQSTETFLPAVGRVSGQGGAQFYTTVWVTNLTSAPVSFTFDFLKQGQANTSPASFSDSLAPGRTKMYENVVESNLGLSAGLGAARITSSGEILIAERIYNQEPGDDLGKSEGLFFAGVPKSFSISLGQSATIQGINQGGSENFRYNFELVETGGGSPTVHVALLDDEGATLGARDYALVPYEQLQPNVSDLFSGVATTNARISATVTGGTGSVLIAGAQVANESQDSTGFEMSFPDFLGGVTSLNGLRGALTLEAGANISIAPDGSSALMISATVAQGPAGPAGATGPRGVTGATGPQGPAGAPGPVLPFLGSIQFAGSAFEVKNTGTGSGGGNAIEGHTATAANGVYGASDNGAGIGVTGRAGTGSGIAASSRTGVLGDSDSGPGILGQSASGEGVHGTSIHLSGVYGHSSTGAGVWGESTGYDAVHGHTSNPIGNTSGVAGFGDGSNNGVFGVSSTGTGVFGGSGSGAGVWGESSGYDAIHGHTSNPNNNTSGVAGFGDGNNTGVFGYSTFGTGVHGIANGSGGVGDASGVLGEAYLDGVHGHTRDPNDKSSGVAGIGDGSNNGVFGASTSGFGINGLSASGSGVFGHSDTGYGMATDGPAQQAIDKGGWVKAMIVVSQQGGNILQCFNSQAVGAQINTPPCGFTFNNPRSGDIEINVGFNVDHSFVLATGSGEETTCGLNICPEAVIAVNGWNDGNGNFDFTSGNVVVVGAYDSSGNPTSDGTITIIVF